MKNKKNVSRSTTARKKSNNSLIKDGSADLIKASLLIKAAFMPSGRKAFFDDAKSAFNKISIDPVSSS